MSRFSERMGLTGPKAFQVDSMDAALTNRLWNVIDSGLEAAGNEAFDALDTLDTNQHLHRFSQQILVEFLAQTRDSIPLFWILFVGKLKSHFMLAQWHAKYDLLEAIYKSLPLLTTVMPLTDQKWFADACNKVLEREKSAYRFVGGTLGPITSPEEMMSIEEAQQSSDQFKPASTHIATALRWLVRLS